MRDLNAALAQATVRMDQIEHDYGARLDKLSERIDQNSSSGFADIAARLDKLEQKVAAPAVSASQFADIMARLDRLEKSAALAPPASQSADIAARLDRLEKKAAAPGALSSEGGETESRLDKGEKKIAVLAASPAAPLPPATPKPSALTARAEPSAVNEKARPNNPDAPKLSLRNYSIEYVQGGIAVVSSRYGSQQVAAGDTIPGAGRVLRIGRWGGKWFVLTSLGLIGNGPTPR